MQQQVEHLLAVFHPARVNFLAQHVLGIRIVQPLVEFESRVATRLVNCPSGEAARHLGHVFLRVAAVHAQRVQLHQLARVILIQPALISFLRLLRIRHRRRPAPPHSPRSVAPSLAHGAFRSDALRRARVRAQPVVQVKQHRRALRRAFQQSLEFTQRVRPDHVPFIGSQQPAVVALSRKHVEVVEPKVVHHLFELPLAVNRARDFRHAQLGNHALRPFAVILESARRAIRIAASLQRFLRRDAPGRR